MLPICRYLGCVSPPDVIKKCETYPGGDTKYVAVFRVLPQGFAPSVLAAHGDTLSRCYKGDPSLHFNEKPVQSSLCWFSILDDYCIAADWDSHSLAEHYFQSTSRLWKEQGVPTNEAKDIRGKKGEELLGWFLSESGRYSPSAEKKYLLLCASLYLLSHYSATLGNKSRILGKSIGQGLSSRLSLSIFTDFSSYLPYSRSTVVSWTREEITQTIDFCCCMPVIFMDLNRPYSKRVHLSDSCRVPIESDWYTALVPVS